MRGLLMFQTFFPYINMFFKMLLGDFLKFLVLLIVVIVGFGAAWTKVLGMEAGSAHACLEDFHTREYGAFAPYTQMLEDAVSGAADGFFDCAHEMGVPEGAWTITVLFCIVVVLILLNMLIAMMSATFSEIWEDRDVDFIFSKAQRTLDIIDQPPAPPPLCALSLPYGAVSLVVGAVKWRASQRVLPSSARSSPPSPPPSPAPAEAAPEDAAPAGAAREEAAPAQAAVEEWRWRRRCRRRRAAEAALAEAAPVEEAEPAATEEAEAAATEEDGGRRRGGRVKGADAAAALVECEEVHRRVPQIQPPRYS